MKFGKRLRDLLEDSLPEWKNKFLAYKDLKKRLKSLPSGNSPAQGTGQAAEENATEENASVEHGVARSTGKPSEEIFVELLNSELEKFNSFFMEKEEEFVIRMQVLHENIERMKAECSSDILRCTGCTGRVNDLRRAIVSLHGEMILLENYSTLNYTGLVKILKKHDKRTGLLLRYPFISNVLRQPFLTTEIIHKLVKDCEQCIQVMFPSSSPAGSQIEGQSQAVSTLDNGALQRVGREATGASERDNTALEKGDRDSSPDSQGSPSGQHREQDEDMDAVYRSTLTALRSLQEIRGSSKTPHPLVAEAGSFPGMSFQCNVPKDSQSDAGKGQGDVSATSTPGTNDREGGTCVGDDKDGFTSTPGTPNCGDLRASEEGETGQREEAAQEAAPAQEGGGQDGEQKRLENRKRRVEGEAAASEDAKRQKGSKSGGLGGEGDACDVLKDC